MDVIQKFIEACKEHMPDSKAREAFIGFAKDAEEDPQKEACLKLWCEEYMNGDGTFEEAMFSQDDTALLDFYEEYLATQ